MADKHNKGISLKALVDKENSRVIYVESDADFVDVLFSLLTIPMGAIIGRSRNHPAAVGIGSMNNLYESVEKFDEQHLQTEACKVMLLNSRNGAEALCNNLKLKIEYGQPTRYFLCSSCKLLSHYKNTVCGCGRIMTLEKDVENPNKTSFASRDGGVFVKGLNKFIISDDLQVMPLSSEASFSLFSKLGVTDESTIVEMAFNVGEDTVLNLLRCSLVSKTPLSETLLKQKPILPESSKESFSEGGSVQSQTAEANATTQDGKICVKLLVSKSRKMICYAEAGEDFINLLLSFLTVALGYVVKEMQGGSLEERCIDHLHNSVHDLDEKYFKSNHHKKILASPKLAPGFGYESQPLCIEEATHQPYYYGYNSNYGFVLTNDKGLFSVDMAVPLRVMDPKYNYNEGEHGVGFLRGPAMFTVTDNLIITSISPISSLYILNKLQVPLSDVEVRVVHVGKEEALCLLVSSYVSESALTNAFIHKEPARTATNSWL